MWDERILLSSMWGLCTHPGPTGLVPAYESMPKLVPPTQHPGLCRPISQCHTSMPKPLFAGLLIEPCSATFALTVKPTPSPPCNSCPFPPKSSHSCPAPTPPRPCFTADAAQLVLHGPRGRESLCGRGCADDHQHAEQGARGGGRGAAVGAHMRLLLCMYDAG